MKRYAPNYDYDRGVFMDEWERGGWYDSDDVHVALKAKDREISRLRAQLAAVHARCVGNNWLGTARLCQDAISGDSGASRPEDGPMCTCRRKGENTRPARPLVQEKSMGKTVRRSRKSWGGPPSYGRDRKPWFKPPRWFKVAKERMLRAKAKDALRNGREPEKMKQGNVWEWT